MILNDTETSKKTWKVKIKEVNHEDNLIIILLLYCVYFGVWFMKNLVVVFSYWISLGIFVVIYSLYSPLWLGLWVGLCYHWPHVLTPLRMFSSCIFLLHCTKSHKPVCDLLYVNNHKNPPINVPIHTGTCALQIENLWSSTNGVC